MNVPQDYHIVVVADDGKVIDLTTGKVRQNLTPSAASIASGEVGISFAGQVVSSETQLCFIPASDEEEAG